MRPPGRRLRVLTLIVVSLAGVLALTACGGDGGEASTDDEASPSLVGAWEFTTTAGSIAVVFKEDGTYELIGPGGPPVDEGTYEIDADTLTLTAATGACVESAEQAEFTVTFNGSDEIAVATLDDACVDRARDFADAALVRSPD